MTSLADPGRMQISGDALKKARDVLQTTCVEALYEYRVACAARSPPGQLICRSRSSCCRCWSWVPSKGSLLRSSSPQAPGADACERAATLELAMASHPAWLCRCALVRGYLFPRDVGSLNPIPASASACAPLSLLDCASHLYVHIAGGAAPDARTRAAIMRRGDDWRSHGADRRRFECFTRADGARRAAAAALLLLDEPSLNGRASLDEETRRARRRLAARSDLLIEDASAHGPPYVDFLCGIHRSIQQRASRRTGRGGDNLGDDSAAISRASYFELSST